eukprot:694151-Pyramimonas_sp.AAC.1
MHSRNQSSKAPLMMLAPDLQFLPEHPGDPAPEGGGDRGRIRAMLQLERTSIRSTNRPLPDEGPGLRRGKPEQIARRIQ